MNEVVKMSAKKNETQDRAVKAYPPPLYARLLAAHAEYTGESISGTVVTAIKQFFEKMPQQERDNVMRISKNMF